jgi:uncharacterized delta-60 repeat protein/CSLREA domain-containing protein
MPRILRRHISVELGLIICFLLLSMSLPAGSARWLEIVRPTAQAATTFTVNSTADGPDINPADGVCNDGSGVCTLRAAIQEANAASGADTINFSLAANSTITLNTQLPAFIGNISIVGPGANLLTIQRSSAVGTPIFQVFSFTPINGNFNDSVSGLTILNGNATGTFTSNMSGGGIFNFSACALTLTDVVISGSTSTNGGGLYNEGTATLTNCKVTGNNSPSGGGILNRGTLNLTNTIVSGNTAVNGGGIMNDINGVLTVTDSSVSGNIANGGGGAGIINNSGTVGLTNSAISGNTCSCQGGGLANLGGFTQPAGIVTLTNTTVSGNTSTQNGGTGGIYNGLSNNTLTLSNSTVTGNIASGTGSSGVAGIFNATGGTFNLTNSIVANNMPTAGSGISHDLNGTFNSQGYNLIGISNGTNGVTNGVNGDQVGTPAVPLDPLLGPLANNGGPTFTHALLNGSPAIDSANSLLLSDQRGQPRPVDDPNVTNAPGGNATDIGAYEAHSLEVNSTADGGDGLCTLVGTGDGCTLREAISVANTETGAELITFTSALTSGGPATITLLNALPDLASDVMINGPGANRLTIQRSTAGGTPNFRIFTINTGKTVTISNLTISNGSSTSGGGILNQGTLTLNNCNIFGNTSTSFGGGIWNSSGALTLNDCNVGGTGVGQPNTSGTSGSGRSGGGISSFGTLVINRGSVVGNSRGGILLNGTSTLNGAAVTNNTNDEGGGGGLSLFGTVSILNCLIANNVVTSGVGGGGILNTTDTNTVLVNTTITGNSTNGPGGGVWVINSSLTATNVTVTNNRADSDNNGGGTEKGGGIHVSASQVLVHNSIIAGNFGGSLFGAIPDDFSGFTQGADPSSSFNLIGVCSSCGLSQGVNNNQVGVSDPLLGSLADNGGVTQTHALLRGSPALDAGSNARIISPPFSGPAFTDQRGAGFARIVDGPDADTTDTVDIGAFEAQVSVADIADQTINEDGSLSLPFNVGGAASITSVTATSSNTTLVPNNPANISISGSGSSRTLQINPVANASGTSTITVTVNGNNSQTMTDTLLLTVNSVNDAPIDIALSSNSVADNSASSTTVGTFSSSDPDVGNTFTYTLVFGAGSVDNSSFTISGNQLITNSIFDFESKSSYSIRVRSTDQSSAFFEKQFIISVINGPDNPGAISFSSASYSVGEGDGSTNVALTRTGGTDNKVVAKVSLADVTTSPADYVFKPGTFDSSFNVGTGATSGSSALSQLVESVLLQPDGKTIIGGAFLFFNGTPRNRIARINANGSLDTLFNPGTGANNLIFTMALQPDGKIIIGGLFTIYNGTSRFRLARLNSDGTLDSTFGGVPDDAVRAIVVQPDGKIIIAGDFFLYNGISCNRIARLNSDGSFDFSFSTGLGSNAGVTALALQPDGKILVGGGFTNFGSASNTRLVRLESTGSLDGSFNSATLLSLVPHDIVLQPNGKVLVGGEFINNDSPLGRRGIARLNDNGSEDVSFNPGTGTDDHNVEAIVLQPDGKVIIAGQFTTFNTTQINRIARLTTTGALDGSFNPAPGADFPVLAAALQPDGKIIIGGQYTFYDNVSSNGITRVNGDLFVTWVPGDAGNKSITLPIVDDALDEPNETLTFTVTPLSGGATTGANPTATLTIADNDPSATTLSSVSGSGAFGGMASLTATLMSLGSPLNGKTVNFSLNGTPVGNAVTNSNGVATLSGVSLAGINAGFYATAVGAGFTGDVNYSSSNNTGPLNVGKASTATLVASSVNPSAFGQSVTFTATVTSVGGVPGGIVQFKSDGSNIGSTVALNSSGVASLTTSALTSGTHTITADYSGNSNFLFSTGTLAAVQVVIPSLAINDVSTTEGDSGLVNATFTITLSAPSNQTVTVNFATTDGTAHTIPAPPGITPEGSDYFSHIGSVTFAPLETSKPVSVAVIGDFTFESNETFFLNLSAPTNATISDAQGTGTITNDDAPGGKITFSSPIFNVAEIAGSILISVDRKGDTSQAVTVDYETADLTADGRKDYTPSSGTLHFDVGQGGRVIQVLINMDAFPEASELVQLTLSNPTGGAALGVQSTTTLQIDNIPWSGPPANPIDDAERFVRQHYHDFLNREAANDPDGLAFWTNQITECQQPGATCDAELRRINVSAAFFLSIEFQETGYLIERLYKSAYGDATGTSNFGPPHQLPVPVIRFNEFLPDTQRIGEGVVVGRTGWEQVLESNKVAFILDFVSRLRFTTAYPTTMTPAEFVDALYLHAGVTPSAAERTSVIGAFGGAGTSVDTAARARVLRRVAESSALVQQEKNRAFVLIQYFGYLRRDPNDLPDSDYSGYDFWLTKLNEFNGNFVNADMVKAFIVSGEYRQRFGP